MNDMAPAIIPKSDQLNADDLLAGPITIKVTDVAIRPGTEQPVSIFYEGDKGKPYKACKSMCRVLVTAWGADASKYKGRSLTLFCDPKVKWGGMEVGGIRISHMSDIDSAMTMALTVTRANKKPFTVKPLRSATTTPGGTEKGASAPPSKPAPQESSAPQVPESATTGTVPPSVESPAGPTGFITEQQIATLETICDEIGMPTQLLKDKVNVKRLSEIPAANYQRCIDWLTKAREKVRA